MQAPCQDELQVHVQAGIKKEAGWPIDPYVLSNFHLPYRSPQAETLNPRLAMPYFSRNSLPLPGQRR